ncbi:MAG: hypothetical protein JMDDDDMK_00335 [Acidobacteria bacterium]|nr:hypothetical protein [Acidobacteriota bacterium]
MQRGENGDVERGGQLRGVFAVPKKMRASANAKPRGLRRNLVAQFAVAHQDEMNARIGLHDFRRRFDQVTMSFDRLQSGDRADNPRIGVESEFAKKRFTLSFAQRAHVGGRVQSVVDHHNFAGAGAAHFQDVIAYAFGVHQHAVRKFVNVPGAPIVQAAVGQTQMALRGDHARSAQPRRRRADYAGVKIVRVQQPDPLPDHHLAEPQKLLNRVRVIKTSQRKFRRNRETRGNLLAQRPAPRERRQPHVETAFVNSVEQFSRLPFGAASVEAVDQVKHARALDARLNRARAIPLHI